jgi:hypothetical protein
MAGPRRIVDGMNVIGARPDGWWRDRAAAMRRLAGELAGWAARTGEDVVLVLDGRERDLGAHPGVTVRFAPVADDLIAKLAAPGDVVVSSDRGLRDRLPAGVAVEGSSGFRQALQRNGSDVVP